MMWENDGKEATQPQINSQINEKKNLADVSPVLAT